MYCTYVAIFIFTVLFGWSTPSALHQKKTQNGNKKEYSQRNIHKHGHQFECHVIRIILVDPFHNASMLLHLFVHQSSRGAVGNGWMVHVYLVSPDLYALRRLQNT